jgi:hypothetical protein
MADKREFTIQDHLILMALGLIPDMAIAFLVTKLIEGGWETFWWCWAAIEVVAILYWMKNAIWNAVVWRVFLRRRTTEHATLTMQACKFPRPNDFESDVDDYLWRIVEDDSQPIPVRLRAAEWRMAVLLGKRNSLQRGLQIAKAWNDALKAHRRSFAELAGPAPA